MAIAVSTSGRARSASGSCNSKPCDAKAACACGFSNAYAFYEDASQSAELLRWTKADSREPSWVELRSHCICSAAAVACSTVGQQKTATAESTRQRELSVYQVGSASAETGPSGELSAWAIDLARLAVPGGLVLLLKPVKGSKCAVTQAR